MIRKINNVAPAVTRPLRLEDIQMIWDGLNSALASPQDTPKIISGFEIKSDSNVSAGVIAFNGSLWYHPDTAGFTIPVGAEIYAHEINDDSRTFGDGTVRPFYLNQIVSIDNTGVLIGTASEANLSAWKVAEIEDGSITTAKLANEAVTPEKLATIPGTKIQELSLTGNRLANRTIVGYEKIVAGSITGQELASNTIVSNNLSRTAVGLLWRGLVTTGAAVTAHYNPFNITVVCDWSGASAGTITHNLNTTTYTVQMQLDPGTPNSAIIAVCGTRQANSFTFNTINPSNGSTQPTNFMLWIWGS